jgi:hypothetical protein
LKSKFEDPHGLCYLSTQCSSASDASCVELGGRHPHTGYGPETSRNLVSCEGSGMPQLALATVHDFLREVACRNRYQRYLQVFSCVAKIAPTPRISKAVDAGRSLEEGTTYEYESTKRWKAQVTHLESGPTRLSATEGPALLT